MGVNQCPDLLAYQRRFLVDELRALVGHGLYQFVGVNSSHIDADSHFGGVAQGQLVVTQQPDDGRVGKAGDFLELG